MQSRCRRGAGEVVQRAGKEEGMKAGSPSAVRVRYGTVQSVQYAHTRRTDTGREVCVCVSGKISPLRRRSADGGWTRGDGITVQIAAVLFVKRGRVVPLLAV